MGIFTKKTSIESIKTIIKLAKECVLELNQGLKTGELKKTKRLIEIIVKIDVETIKLIEKETDSEKLRKASEQIYYLAKEALEDIKSYNKWEKAKLTIEKLMELENIILRNEEAIMKIAKDKSNELESSKEFFVRFMNLYEFKEIYEKGIVPKKEAMIIDEYDAGYLHYPGRNTFQFFKGKNAYTWSKIIRKATKMAGPDPLNPETYRLLREKYLKFFIEGNKLKRKGVTIFNDSGVYEVTDAKVYALKKLRRELIISIGSVVAFLREDYKYGKGDYADNYTSYEKYSQKFSNQSDKKVIEYFKRDYQRSKYIYSKHQNLDKLMRGLLEDENYLVKNERELENIMLDSLYHKGLKAYDLIFFVLPQYFDKHAGWQSPMGFSIWGGLIESKLEDSSLGVIVITPSRKLLQDVTKLVVDNSIGSPQRAIPVYNTHGKLYWPR